MDELDFSIINLLKTNGRRPFTEIADRLGVSEGTVRNRVSKLTEDEVLHIVGLVDPNRVGLNAPAMVGVEITSGDIEEIGRTIAAYPEVSYLNMVSGEFDFILETLCKDRDHLANFINQKLRRIIGIGRTQTFITLRTFKTPYGVPGKSPDGEE
jgi:Lrp/AsnC family transcriptional regulator, regulator for asnA, asnC and gidA